MKKIHLTILIATVLAICSFAILESINWKVKEDSYSVTFDGGKVKGAMKGLKTTILFDETNPEKSKITATIDAKTLNTGNGMLNKHAMSETAIDAEKYPEITFVSESVSGKSGSYTATGKLTLKGVTKERCRRIVQRNIYGCYERFQYNQSRFSGISGCDIIYSGY